MSLNVYWAMAFILPKGVIRAVEKKVRNFLWKGNSAVGYPKVAWSDVCRPIEEGGLGIRDILALNKALMSRHLWNVIQNNQSSIWVKLIGHTHLRHKSVMDPVANVEVWLLGLEKLSLGYMPRNH
ncbi:putative ribonuclease H protein [Sesamum angolense]|uniref:Ribonuclease H protein n=1 Tax=Sesamum angolense TaxID=2727404 RepID=A0AAE1TB85_9LAMI|nr:putative ribonuclease H protein [Sesamum angolense]